MLEHIIKSFDQEISSLNKFFHLIKPVVEDVHNTALTKGAPSIGPLFFALEAKEISDSILRIKEEINKCNTEEKVKLEAKLVELNAKLEQNIEVMKKVDSSFSVEIDEYVSDDEKSSAKFKIIGDQTLLNKSFREIGEGQKMKKLLYRSSFTSLISISEYFFSQLLHHIYNQFPEKANIESKPLTLKELKEFDDVQSAIDHLIASKVENLVRKDVESWFESLQSEVGLSMGYYKEIKHSFIERYLRRNIIIHNGGIVNSIYLSKIDKSIEHNLIKDVEISLTEEYLGESISMLHRIFLLVGFELWKKLEPVSELRGDLLGELTYSNMVDENWNVARGLSLFLKGDKKQSVKLTTIGQLNYWECSRRLGLEKEVAKEIALADYSDKSALFQCALASLRGDFDKFSVLARTAIESKDLSVEQLYDFPILEAMRLDDRFTDWVTKTGYVNPVQELLIESEEE